MTWLLIVIYLRCIFIIRCILRCKCLQHLYHLCTVPAFIVKLFLINYCLLSFDYYAFEVTVGDSDIL